MICWPHFRSPMPSFASWGFCRATPRMLRTAGSASNPNRRSGDERWKNDSAFDWTIWPRLMIRRRSTPVGGGSTARMSSTALADAMRWLTGQIPQMRDMSAGISWTGRPWVMRSNPRNWVTWKWASTTSPRSSSWMVILEWPSMRVTGSMTMVRRIWLPSATEPGPGHVRDATGQQVIEQGVDEVGRWRAARQEDVDLHHPVDRRRSRQELRHDVRRYVRVQRHVLQVGPIQQGRDADRVSHARHVGGDGTVAERDECRSSCADQLDLVEVILAGHGALDQADIDVLREFLEVDKGTVNEVGPLEDV